MAAPRITGRVKALLSRFRHDRRANVAVIFCIASVPVIGMVGAAVDYSLATRMKSKLSSAADAAAVASVSEYSAAWRQAMSMTTNGSVPNGVTEANNIFNGNAATTTGYQNLSVNSTVTKTGPTINSTVQWSAQVPVTFIKALNVLPGVNWQYMTISGTSQANSDLPKYLDFYLMLDVSGSMGLPSTSAEAVRMQNVNPDNYRQYPTGCTLACHFSPQNSACTDTGTQGYPTNGYCLGYAISRVSQSGYQGLLVAQNPLGQYPWKNAAASGQYQKLPSTIVSGLPNSLYNALPPVSSCSTPGTDACIQLRLDAVGYAVNQLFATANDPTYQKVTNQFRIGLYPYINSLYSSYFPLTSSINGNPQTPGTINYAAATLASLLDTNMNANLGSGGTNQDAALLAMNNLITSVGDGSSSSSTLPYVFMVTDGAVTPQTKGVPNGGWSGSNHDTVIPTPDQNCTNLKNKGIKVSILYIPFQPINPVNASFAGDEDDAANNNIPNIPGSLQACASAADASGSYFYTANTPQDITSALQAMFKHALITAHLTH
jgi:Flp pilus assembly protein TadG